GAAEPSVPWESEWDFVEHRIDSSNRNALLVGGAGSCHGAPSEDRQGHSEGPNHDSDRVSQASSDRGGKSTRRGRPWRCNRLPARRSPRGPWRFPVENDDVETDAENPR